MAIRNRLMLLSIILTLGCCTKGSGSDRLVSGGDAMAYFEGSDSILLEELEGDLIGQIGAFSEAADGGVILADGILPRVRAFDSEGHARAAFGNSGEGPFEFRSVRGVYFNQDSETLVVDARLGRLTILNADFEPARIIQPRPVPRGQILGMGTQMLLETSPGARSIAITSATQDGVGNWSVTPPTFARIMEVPYWAGVSTMPAAASSELLAVAFSLLYPIYLYDSKGTLVDSLASPSGSFRVVPALAPGALIGQEAELRQEDFLESFDIIADLSVVSDTLLFVTHGQLTSTSAAMFEEVHKTLDVYHLPTRIKLAEDLTLPEGSRVLGGGTALYLLVSEPPDPWRILRLKPG